MSRRGWKTLNIPQAQVERIDKAVEAGYGRNRDDFVRTWAEIGLTVISLVEAGRRIIPETPPATAPATSRENTSLGHDGVRKA